MTPVKTDTLEATSPKGVVDCAEMQFQRRFLAADGSGTRVGTPPGWSMATEKQLLEFGVWDAPTD